MPDQNVLTDADILDLFKGLIRLVKRQYEMKISALESELAALKMSSVKR
jgi:hypothetical protein